jgi:hypothetical protein
MWKIGTTRNRTGKSRAPSKNRCSRFNDLSSRMGAWASFDNLVGTARHVDLMCYLSTQVSPL